MDTATPPKTAFNVYNKYKWLHFGLLILERADASLVQKGVPSLILEDDLTRQLRSMAADAAQAPCQAVFDLNEFNELTGLEASF